MLFITHDWEDELINRTTSTDKTETVKTPKEHRNSQDWFRSCFKGPSRPYVAHSSPTQHFVFILFATLSLLRFETVPFSSLAPTTASPFYFIGYQRPRFFHEARVIASHVRQRFGKITKKTREVWENKIRCRDIRATERVRERECVSFADDYTR